MPREKFGESFQQGDGFPKLACLDSRQRAKQRLFDRALSPFPKERQAGLRVEVHQHSAAVGGVGFRRKDSRLAHNGHNSGDQALRQPGSSGDVADGGARMVGDVLDDGEFAGRNPFLVAVAGGGDTVAALNHAGTADDMTFVSTAGGAFLEWMEGKELPGVAVLKDARNG